MGTWCPSRKKEDLSDVSSGKASPRRPLKQLISDITMADTKDGDAEELYSTQGSDNNLVDTISLGTFQLIEAIGKGPFGKVLLVRHRNNGKHYAMKVIKKHRVKNEDQREKIMRERNIFLQIKHPYIVTLHYSFQSDTKLFLVLDYLGGGNLLKMINQYRWLTEEQARYYLWKIILAIEYLHQNNIVYRNLKPQNIMLDNEGNVKLTDFGLSKINFDENQENSIWGNVRYVAPEILENKKYTEAVDWWSLGMIFYEMIVGSLPYKSDSKYAIMEHVINGQFEIPENKCSLTASDLWRQLLVQDPNDRLGTNGASEIMSHPFFDGVNWKDVYNNKEPEPENVLIPMFSKLDTHDELDEGTIIKINTTVPKKFEGFTYAGEEVLTVKH